MEQSWLDRGQTLTVADRTTVPSPAVNVHLHPAPHLNTFSCLPEFPFVGFVFVPYLCLLICFSCVMLAAESDNKITAHPSRHSTIREEMLCRVFLQVDRGASATSSANVLGERTLISDTFSSHLTRYPAVESLLTSHTWICRFGREFRRLSDRCKSWWLRGEKTISPL